MSDNKNNTTVTTSVGWLGLLLMLWLFKGCAPEMHTATVKALCPTCDADFDKPGVQ